MSLEARRAVAFALGLHDFLEAYYGSPARVIMARQATYGGPIESCVE